MDKTKAGYLEGTVSILLNTALFCAKMWVSVITGSIALAADAWHTLSDSITSLMVIIAAKFSSKKADKEHPYGHGRWEQIAALLIAVVLGIIAFEFLRNSILTLFGEQKKAVEFGTWAIVVTVASIVVKELMAQFAYYLGRKYESTSLIADGWHHRSDALSSLPVLVGIICARYFDVWQIDAILGMIVALMLFYATFEIMKETIDKILGEAPSQKLIDSIKTEISLIHPESLGIHHFHIHNYVSHRELTFHIRLENNLTIETGHKIASDIEKMIEKKFDMTATIHVEPLNREK
ncbi:MAG: cation diffusion facilitator family transporter [Chitinivibrionia bacterium]|nr:cation diffusion facilitator family transporter [Chitinivibrionia bacterium]